MVTFRAFISSYFLCLAFAIVLSLTVLPAALPSLEIIVMWILMVMGIVIYRAAHNLTKRAVEAKGGGVEANPVTRDAISKQRFNFALTASIVTQAAMAVIATLYVVVFGYFYTLFLAWAIVAVAFIFLDWVNDFLVIEKMGLQASQDPR